MESIETTGKGGDEKRKWHTERSSQRKGEQSREKSTAFCNEPWLSSSTIPSVGFHFVSMPPRIFSFSPCAVIMLSCRTCRKEKDIRNVLSLAPTVGGSVHFPFQTFRLEMCTVFRRFHLWTHSVVSPRSDAASLQGNMARKSTQCSLCPSLIQMHIGLVAP